VTPAPLPILDPAFYDAAQTARAWPFEEARKIVKRLEKTGKKEALFETGYGPSGLPHIGTFGEVARTTMVRTAFRLLTRDEIPTRLLCFSDDMDGMRKIPDNVPSKAALEPYLQMPLTSVPDPWTNEFPSFGAHNNAMLRRFLDTFRLQLRVRQRHRILQVGQVRRRAAARRRALRRHHEGDAPDARRRAPADLFAVPADLADLGPHPLRADEERRREGRHRHLRRRGRHRHDRAGDGRHVKLQWKPDFGMRWAALGVDFEMFGKDHQTNQSIYDRICEILGGKAPEHYVYELFLDENGQKISKSKGNGLTIDEWLTYASPESLGLYMFQKPRQAKRLYFDVIPRAVDEYYSFVAAYQGQPSSSVSRTRLSTCISATRRKRRCRSPSRCCSTSCRPRTPMTPTCCGASSRAM
jgi:lysyl-tRNA synthetase class 1